jgi:diacylglycerol kinase (ATP)
VPLENDLQNKYFTVVNPAAGAGRCGKLSGPALDRLRSNGITLEIVRTSRPREGVKLVREAYRQGFRKFLAVGGDGTSHEIVNGLFPEATHSGRPTLAFLPLGTGNSFLRDFSDRGVNFSEAALLAGRSRPCDLMELTHPDGLLYSINLLSIGFAADVATLTNRCFKSLGVTGYLAGVLVCLIRLRRWAFPHRCEGDSEFDRRRCLFLTFNNSQYTGGTMHIAPQADSGDGWIEFVRWGPISRLELIWNLHRLYDGSHVHHPQASRRAVRYVGFDLDDAVNMMVDGEVIRAQCQSLRIMPAALNVMV